MMVRGYAWRITRAAFGHASILGWRGGRLPQLTARKVMVDTPDSRAVVDADDGPGRSWWYAPTDASMVFGTVTGQEICGIRDSPLFTITKAAARAPSVTATTSRGGQAEIEFHVDDGVWREILSFLPLRSCLALSTTSTQWRRSGTLGRDHGRTHTSAVVDHRPPPAAPRFWQSLRGVFPDGLQAHVTRLLRRASERLPGPPDVVLVFLTAEKWNAWTEPVLRIVRSAVPALTAVLTATAAGLRDDTSGATVHDGIAIVTLRLGRPLERMGPAAVAAAHAAAKALCVHERGGAHADGLDLVRLLELDPPLPPPAT